MQIYDKVLLGIALSLAAGIITGEILFAGILSTAIMYYGLFVNPPT